MVTKNGWRLTWGYHPRRPMCSLSINYRRVRHTDTTQKAQLTHPAVSRIVIADGAHHARYNACKLLDRCGLHRHKETEPIDGLGLHLLDEAEEGGKGALHVLFDADRSVVVIRAPDLREWSGTRASAKG